MCEPTNPTLTLNQQRMMATFQQHMLAEMTGDLTTTMATMTTDPYVYHVPVMTGGTGYAGVRQSSPTGG